MTHTINCLMPVTRWLDFNAWAAESRFEILDEVVHPTLDHAYNEAMHEFKLYKDYLDDDLKQTALRVVTRVAEAYHGTSEMQQLIIDRFKDDLHRL